MIKLQTKSNIATPSVDYADKEEEIKKIYLIKN